MPRSERESSGGRGKGRTNRGRRERDRSRTRKHYKGGSDSSRRPTKFKGKCEALKGHVFDMGGFRTIESYNETVRELSEYVSSTFSHGAGGDVKRCIEKMTEVTPGKMPIKPKPAKADSLTDEEESLLDLYKTRMKDYAARDRDMQTACRMTYSLAYGQCSPTVRSKLEALPEYAAVAARDESCIPRKVR